MGKLTWGKQTIHVNKGKHCYSLEGPKDEIEQIKKKVQYKLYSDGIRVEDGPCKDCKLHYSVLRHYQSLTAKTCAYEKTSTGVEHAFY